MSRQAVIVDTNVVVAGLLTGNAKSPVARILDGLLAAAFPFVLSEALLAEYRDVLLRPALRKLHGLTLLEVETLLTDIAPHAIPMLTRRRAASIHCCDDCNDAPPLFEMRPSRDGDCSNVQCDPANDLEVVGTKHATSTVVERNPLGRRHRMAAPVCQCECRY